MKRTPLFVLAVATLLAACAETATAPAVAPTIAPRHEAAPPPPPPPPPAEDDAEGRTGSLVVSGG